MLLVERAGLDPKRYLEVLEASTFRSPWYLSKGAAMLRRDFAVHFALKHMHKDLRLMGELAGERGVGLPVTKAVEQLFASSEAAGRADVDYSAILGFLEEQATVQDAIETHNGWDLDRAVEMAMDALRVPPGEQSVTEISGGERRRVALCRLLLAKPDILLLDEPTNHLDAESVAWLERYLKEYPGTVVAITHDRYFLDNVAGWILELDRGAGIPWEGNYSSWLDQKKQRLAVEEKQESARQLTLARELEWVRMSPRARQAKSKARVASYEALLAEERERAQGAAEILMRSAALSRDLRLSKCLGSRFSTNGDMIAALYGQRCRVNAAPAESTQLRERNVGPTITGIAPKKMSNPVSMSASPIAFSTAPI